MEDRPGPEREPEPGVRILRLQAPPRSYMDHVNLILVGEGPFALIDAGYPETSAEAAEWVEAAAGGALEAVLLTHHHYDHFGGAEALCARSGARAFAHPVEIALMRERAPELEPAPLEEGGRVRVGPVELAALHTPGHSPGHLSFWWAERGILFGGDNVLLPTTTSIVSPLGNLRHYIRTLERVRELAPRRIYPGHGPPVRDPAARVNALLAHRARREAQILEALSAGRDTPERIARGIYRGLSERQISMGAAMVVSHLDKLISEGRVRVEADRYALRG